MSDDPSSSPTGRADFAGRGNALSNPEAIAVALTASPEWGPTDGPLCTAAETAARAAVIGSGRSVAGGPVAVELSLVLTTDDVIRGLNAHYRDKDRPTNVLAFPMLTHAAWNAAGPGADPHPDADAPLLLGDVVLARGVVGQEAASQGKTLADHVSHLVVHGVLHLLGHDHDRPAAATAMERCERRILAGLGISDPYAPALDEVST